MTTKRRNHGRAKPPCSRGRTRPLHCFNCGRLTPKDKAIGRFVVRRLLDQASARDVAEASPVYGAGFPMPKLYMKQRFCIACAIHKRVVRARPVENRKRRYTSKVAFRPPASK
ncbi:ribosomal protein S26 [Trypanosoma grayi]|uniref:ribosomal protein S26 n=1 Tax=Trypanosoma grayi TaxID=71804 RepID=UPI0004F470C7|nr:ribosomal protein S26 [Trypanosoma grayi]KEG08560.1 ribosomal protein S26 [Trypanosoma grayi]